MNLIKISNNMETEYTKYSKEELHEMINQTIVDGGDKITAHMLNLLLNHMVEGAGSGSGGGTGASAATVIFKEVLGASDKEMNASVFEQCKQAYLNNVPFPIVMIDLTEQITSELGEDAGMKMCYVAGGIAYSEADGLYGSMLGGVDCVLLMIQDGGQGTFTLLEDGTITMV